MTEPDPNPAPAPDPSPAPPPPPAPDDPTRRRLAGLQRLLLCIRGKQVHLSELLTRNGFSPAEVDRLRTERLEAFLNHATLCLRVVCERYEFGSVLAEILARVFGYEQAAPAPFAAIAQAMRAPRERVQFRYESAMKRLGTPRGWRQVVGAIVVAAEVALDVRKRRSWAAVESAPSPFRDPEPGTDDGEEDDTLGGGEPGVARRAHDVRPAPAPHERHAPAEESREDGPGEGPPAWADADDRAGFDT